MTEEETEQPFPLERAVEAAVTDYLRPMIDDKRKLKSLALHAVVDQILPNVMADGQPEKLVRNALHIALKHQIRAVTEAKSIQEQRVTHITQFLADDCEHAMERAIEQGRDDAMRTTKRLEPLIQETSLEINQLLLKAKQEFSSTDEFDPTVQKAVQERIDQLDTRYSLTDITDTLRRRLGIAFVAQVRKKLHEIVQLNLQNLDDTALATDQTISQCKTLLEKAYARLPTKFPEKKIRALVTLDLDKLTHAYTELEQVAPHFSS